MPTKSIRVHFHVPSRFLTQEQLDTAMDMIDEMKRRHKMEGNVFLRMVNYPMTPGCVVPGELRISLEHNQLPS